MIDYNSSPLGAEYNLLSNNKKISYLSKSISYTPYTGCLLKHILYNHILTNNEKLFYILADSLSLINGKNTTSQRSIALSSSTWAEKLDCSKTEIFSLQKSLEEKGYFIIIRDTNRLGKNKRNVIIPTIPDLVFNNLLKEPDRFNSPFEGHPNLSMLNPVSKITNNSCLYEHSKKRIYLDKTKLFIKLNYQILSTIVASTSLSSFAKIVWLDFYSKCYKNYVKSRSYTANKHLNDYFAFTCSYLELQNSFSCSKALISKTINSLEGVGFVKRSRFHVKNDDINDNLCDKSLWNITVSLPPDIDKKYSKKFMDIKPETVAGKEVSISVCDPYISNSDQLYIKDPSLKNNDLDSLDTKQESSDDFVSSSPNLSVSFKNNETNKNYSKSKNHYVLNNTLPIANDKTSILSKVGKSLKDFYPLTKEQVDKLNSSSGREFSINFANQLLMKLYSRDTSKVFLSRNHLMAYMTKAFSYEKHQAPMVNHESFRFAANLSEENKHEQEIEKYLTEVETSPDTSYSSQLRKKITGVFESKLAYHLLTKVKFDYLEALEESGNNSFIVSLPDNLKLTNPQMETLEKQVRSIYGLIDISYETIKYTRNQTTTTNLSSTATPTHLLNHNYDVGEQDELNHNCIWYKVRNSLREALGEAIDDAWFSKLKAEEDINTRTITLIASSNFYRDWINNHYEYAIRKHCNKLGYQLLEVSA